MPVMLLALCACGVPEAPGGSSARVRAQFDAARSSARWHPWGAAEQGRLGMVFAAYQQNDAAAKLFDRARELDAAEFRWHYYAAAHFALAKLYRKSGDEADAVRHEALHSKHRVVQPPEDDPLLAALNDLDLGPLAETRRGFAAMDKGRFEDASRHFRNTIEAAPASDAAHAGLIHIAFKTGQWQQGSAQFATATQAEPRALYSRLYYAKILEAESKKGEALAIWREAIAINPDFGEAHLMAGMLAEETGDGPAATRHFREAVRTGSNPREAHYLLGRRLFLEGVVETAIAELRLTLEPVDEKTPRYLLLLASALERTGRKGEAAEFRKRAGR